MNKIKIIADHTMVDGTLTVDDQTGVLFEPTFPVKDTVKPFHGQGTGQLLSDGTFEFVKKSRLRAQSLLIKKLPHGRVSHTKDNAIQLTLKIYLDEGLFVPIVLLQEAMEGEKAVSELLRKVQQ